MIEEEIDRHTQPATPAETSVTEGASTHDESDSEENALIEMEIQRVIQETLARKKDEEVASRMVTVEDVPNAEY
jgi:hypothetical protein